MKRFFLLDWHNLIIIFIAEIISIIFHYIIYFLFNVEEQVFFYIAVLIIPLYLLISIIYTLVEYSKLKKEVHLKRKIVLDHLEKDSKKKIKPRKIKKSRKSSRKKSRKK